MKSTSRHASWWSSWIQFYLTLTPGLAQSAPCPLCSNGPEQIPDRDRLVDPTQGNTLNNTCGFLADSGTGFIQEGTDLCQEIRSAATTCGCNIPPDACLLCWDGSRAPNVDLELVDYPATDLVPVSAGGILLDCRTLEGALHTMNENDPQCSIIQKDAGERCGCPPFPGSGEEEGTATNNETSLAPSETAVAASVPEGEAEPLEPCPVCVGGEPVPLPNKPLIIDVLSIRTCGDLESFAALLVGGSDECRPLQWLGPYCGCAKPPNSCSLCPHGEPVPYKTAQVNLLSAVSPPGAFDSLDDSFYTCEIVESITASNPGSFYGSDQSTSCQFLQFRSNLCGCKRDWRQIVLCWTYRFSGIFSLLGSTLIVVDVLRRKSGKRFTTYRQLVLGMSFFDCISSVSYALATVAAPNDSGLFHARGNNATCKTQGALIQLGLTSMLYNMLVSIYFWLVICRNWKERDFRRIRLWAHVVICGVGAALAFAAIPFVGANLSFCSLLIPPSTPTLWPATIFFTIPLSCVVLVLSLATGAVCRNVYLQQKTVQKWMASRNMALTKKVFWQSFWYVIAFYVTFPWLLLNIYVGYQSSTEVWARRFIVAMFLPSQGLLNFLVYFQRQQRWTRFRCCVKRSMGKKKLKASNASTSIAGRRRMDAKGPSSVSDVDESVDGMEQSKEEEGVESEGRESQEASREGQQSSGGNFEVDSEEARERNDSLDGGEVEFSAVAEYWELNEEYDHRDNDDMGGGLFRGARRASDLQIGRVLDIKSSNCMNIVHYASEG